MDGPGCVPVCVPTQAVLGSTRFAPRCPVANPGGHQQIPGIGLGKCYGLAQVCQGFLGLFDDGESDPLRLSRRGVLAEGKLVSAFVGKELDRRLAVHGEKIARNAAQVFSPNAITCLCPIRT